MQIAPRVDFALGTTVIVTVVNAPPKVRIRYYSNRHVIFVSVFAICIGCKKFSAVGLVLNDRFGRSSNTQVELLRISVQKSISNQVSNNTDPTVLKL